jgi:hypothetical protein
MAKETIVCKLFGNFPIPQKSSKSSKTFPKTFHFLLTLTFLVSFWFSPLKPFKHPLLLSLKIFRFFHSTHFLLRTSLVLFSSRNYHNFFMLWGPSTTIFSSLKRFFYSLLSVTTLLVVGFSPFHFSSF